MLSDAQADASSTVDIDRMTGRVEAAILAGPPFPDLPAPAKTHLGSLTTGKAIVVGAGLAIGTAIGTVWMLKKAPHGVPQPPASVTQPSNTLPANPAASAPPLAESAAAPVENNEGARQSPTPSTPSSPTSRDSRTSGLNEVALLDLARSSLGTDPRRALSLTQEHAKRFPHGALTQEREVIAIEALSRLGQTDAARSRGSEFERHYPGSAHQQKIDQTTRGK
jgi:hypothetical protein